MKTLETLDKKMQHKILRDAWGFAAQRLYRELEVGEAGSVIRKARAEKEQEYLDALNELILALENERGDIYSEKTGK